jgi:hypothetical protein
LPPITERFAPINFSKRPLHFLGSLADHFSGFLKVFASAIDGFTSCQSESG